MGIFPLALSAVLSNRHSSNDSSTSRPCNSFTAAHAHCRHRLRSASETMPGICKAFYLQCEQATHHSCIAPALTLIVYCYYYYFFCFFNTTSCFSKSKNERSGSSSLLCMLLHVSITLPLLTVVCSGIWQLFLSTELLHLSPLPSLALLLGKLLQDSQMTSKMRLEQGRRNSRLIPSLSLSLPVFVSICQDLLKIGLNFFVC